MSRILKEYTILISCPSDIIDEKKIVEEVINNFNRNRSYSYNVIFKCVEWKLGTYSSVGEHPQTQINKQIVDESDMAIALFWNKAGTPTQNSISGTVEEIDRLCKKKKQVFLYYSLRESPLSVDEIQVSRIAKIRDKYKDSSFYKEYSSLNEFRILFDNEFNLYVSKNIRNEKNLLDSKIFNIIPSDMQSLQSKIDQAKKSIFMSGTSLIATLSISLKNCANLDYIHLVMTVQEEGLIGECAKLSYAHKNELLKHIVAVKQHFLEMDVLSNMEVRCINAVMPCSIIGIDLEDPNGMIFVRQYLYGQDPTVCPHYVCYPGDKWFDIYKDQISSLWNDSDKLIG